MIAALLFALGCGEVAEPEPDPPRVTPTAFSKAMSWVRVLDADTTHVAWSSYDVSSGRSARAVIQSAPLEGGAALELAEERHPPHQIQVADGYVYWFYEKGSLKRVPVAGGNVQVVALDLQAKCFTVHGDRLLTIEGAKVLSRPIGGGEVTTLATNALGDCPVVVGNEVFWNERKGIHTVPLSGGDSEKRAEVKVPKGLVAYEGQLYTCLSDLLTQVDPATGQTTRIRSYCKPDGLAVAENGHWFRAPHFEGWPPVERVRVIEVTSSGVSELFDGKGASSPVVGSNGIVWFGRDDDGSSEWTGYRAPLP